jgi:hypothetical protein
LQQKKVGLIKIDVEGGELEVLRGLKDIILANQPSIIIEILPVYSSENIERLSRQKLLQEFIKNLNYEIFRINESNGTYFKIIEIEVHSDLRLSNYLLKPLG